jgi:hypothetical protein
MSDTSGLSHEDLEDIVMNLRKQSIHNDHVHVVKGSDHYQSMEADQALYLGDHIFPVAEPYWCANYDFGNLHDDELLSKNEWWLSTFFSAIGADRGEIKVSSLYSPSVSTLVVTLQFGADFTSWYFALKDCWTDSSLLLGQEELLYDSELLPAQEELSRGSRGTFGSWSASGEHGPHAGVGA